jgi:hypothetical protein
MSRRERVVTIRPAPEYGMRPGLTVTYYVVDVGRGKVRLSRDPDGRFGPVMPRASVKHFVNDLEGKVDLPPSGNPIVDTVITGRAELLGKGDDGVAFRVVKDVVKMSTTVPYVPENSPHPSPRQAAARLREQTAVHNRLASAGCLDPATFVQHGDKGFQIKPYVAIPERFTRAQLDRLQDCMSAIHRAGYAVRDLPQAGIDASGQPVMFDVGKAAPLSPNDAALGYHSAVEIDMDNLRDLYRKHGQRFVRRDVDEAQQRWDQAKDVATRARKTDDGKRHAFARYLIQKAADMRRERARALREGSALEDALATIDDDEVWELRTLHPGEEGFTRLEPLALAAAVTTGAVAGVVLNAQFPEGVVLPLVGRTRASVPLAGGALAGAVVARSLGYRKTARVAGGVALGAGLASVRRARP